MFVVNQRTKQFWPANFITQNSRFFNVEFGKNESPIRFRVSDGLEVGKAYGDTQCLILVDMDEADLEKARQNYLKRQAEQNGLQKRRAEEREAKIRATRNLATKIAEKLDPIIEQAPGIHSTTFRGYIDRFEPEVDPYDSFVVIQAEVVYQNFDNEGQAIETPQARWILSVMWSKMDSGRSIFSTSSGSYRVDTLHEAVSLFFAGRMLGTSPSISKE